MKLPFVILQFDNIAAIKYRKIIIQKMRYLLMYMKNMKMKISFAVSCTDYLILTLK